MLSFSGILYLDAEKIEGYGEDAMTFKFDENGNGYMFVFDGSGGAGSQQHLTLGSKKSAYIASRGCALFLDKYLCIEKLRTDNEIEMFGKVLYSYLVELNRTFPMEPSHGNLVDVLPTTISGIVVDNKDDTLLANFIWAGDSRGYILDSNGISQVT